MHSAVLLRSQVASLQKANEAATRRKKRQKKRIQRQGTLTKAEGLELATQIGVDREIQDKACLGSIHTGASTQRQQRYRRCGEVGYNSRTCQKDEDIAIE